MEKVLFAWSGGKDSAMALYELQKSNKYEVIALLTTVTEGYDRISMHGVRRELLEQQADALGLPLEKVYIPKASSNEVYEARMRDLLNKYCAAGILSVGFGDIFLEDLRKYREGNLAQLGMKGLFPVWKKNTADLCRNFINLGFKAITTCVDTNFLGQEFAGRIIDDEFLGELLAAVDPCGENGEFHSFVFAGPLFKKALEIKKGEIVLRENRYYYCDLLPV